MQISRETPDQPDVIALIADLDTYQDGLYPPESRHALDLTSLKQDNVLFFVARDAARQAVGCGAVVLGDAYGEIKRMYVNPASRGQGVARQLLQAMEAAAQGSGCRLLTLESGPFQPEALGLYAALGFERRGPYGDYADDPLSVFMQKAIGG